MTTNLKQQDVLPCTADEARALTEQIRTTTNALWQLLAEANERKAWSALGYDTFKAYVAGEFRMGRSHAYRLLDMAAVVKALAAGDEVSPIGDTVPESHARELVPLKDDPVKVREAYALAQQTAADEGVNLTAKIVKDAVTEAIAAREERNEAIRDLNARYGRADFDRDTDLRLSRARGALRRCAEEIASLGDPRVVLSESVGLWRDDHLEAARAAAAWLDQFITAWKETR